VQRSRGGDCVRAYLFAYGAGDAEVVALHVGAAQERVNLVDVALVVGIEGEDRDTSKGSRLRCACERHRPRRARAILLRVLW